jgi:hypothetical protein
MSKARSFAIKGAENAWGRLRRLILEEVTKRPDGIESSVLVHHLLKGCFMAKDRRRACIKSLEGEGLVRIERQRMKVTGSLAEVVYPASKRRGHEG